jgi:hypothetical protein
MQPKIAYRGKTATISLAFDAHHSPGRLQSSTLPAFMEWQKNVELYRAIRGWRRCRVNEQTRRTDISRESGAMLGCAMLVDPVKDDSHSHSEAVSSSRLHDSPDRVHRCDTCSCRVFHNGRKIRAI